MVTNEIKNKIITALKSDGFNVVEKKDMVVATKKENILYIRGLENIQSSLNIRYIAEQSSLKSIGGLSTGEVKKLLTEALNKKVDDILVFMCDKLNWGLRFNDSFIFHDNEVKFIEVMTDRREVITMVFYDEGRLDKFFAVEMTAFEFTRLIDKLQYQPLQSIAPSFYQLIQSS